jgi:quercetin dioxygenase-like cupin family protein
MITEQQQEQGSLFALGALSGDELSAFQAELGGSRELRELALDLQRTAVLLARVVPGAKPPPELRQRVLRRIEETMDDSDALAAESQGAAPTPSQGFRYLQADDAADWKPLPVPGAWIKVLSVDLDRGYAVLLGRLAAGARYPAHTHHGAEDLYLLSGDLHVGDRVLQPGDFHHSDAGTSHGENHSIQGCTLLAVVSTEHALAKFAMT